MPVPPSAVCFADGLRFSGRRKFPGETDGRFCCSFFATSLALAVIAKQKAEAVGTFGLPEVPSKRTICDSEPVAPKRRLILILSAIIRLRPCRSGGIGRHAILRGSERVVPVQVRLRHHF